MNLKDDWKKVKSVLEQGQASTVYCSIATVNPDGTPHITPVGTVFLRADQSGYFFDHYAEALGNNIDQNPNVCIMAVNAGRFFWLTRISHRSPASLADCAGYRHYRSFAAEID